MKSHALEKRMMRLHSLRKLLKVMLRYDRVIKIQFAVFVRGKMLAGFAGNIYRAGFICALAAIFCRIGAAVFGYIFVSRIICSYSLSPFIQPFLLSCSCHLFIICSCGRIILTKRG